MLTQNDTRYLHIEPDPSGNAYFGNPYALGYENFVLEHQEQKDLLQDVCNE